MSINHRLQALMTCKGYATKYQRWLLSFSKHCCAPNIMVPWNGGLCMNTAAISIWWNGKIWQCLLYHMWFFLLQISVCGLQRQINKLWVYVPNIIQGTVCIQSFNSVLCRCPFGRNDSFESTWVSLYKLCTPGFGRFPILPIRSSQDSSDWLGNVCDLPSSGLSTDVLWGLSLGFSWTTQRQSEICPEATPPLSWQYASGHRCAKRWTVATVWGRVHSSKTSLFGCIHHSLNSDQPPCTCRWEALPQHDAATTMLHRRDGISQVMSSALCSAGIMFGVLPRVQIFVSWDQRVFFLILWESFKCCLANSKRELGFHLATRP